MLEVIDKGFTTAAHPIPLLFIHGGCSAAAAWDCHFLDFFAGRGFRVIAVSLRGHGSSALSGPLRFCSIADYVDDVRHVAAGLGAPPALIGHSMGCWVALNYIKRHGASAAVLLAPGTPKGLRQWGFRTFRRHPWLILRSNTFGNPLDLFSTPALVREFLAGSGTPESVVEYCVDHLRPESVRAAQELGIKQLPGCRSVTAPVLVLAAGDDGSRVDSDASAVASKYGAELETFQGMGHVMMLEPGWAAVAERIETWLVTRGL